MSAAGRITDAAAAAGVGALAGFAGTAAMTVSSTLESKLRSRQPSDAPAKAAGRVLGVQPKDDQHKQRFGTIVHWGYGTGWGTVRGLLDVAGLSGTGAAGVHLAAVWGGTQLVLPATNASPPAWKWGRTELGIELLHHAIYASTTGLAYGWLKDHRDGSKRHR